MKQNNLSITILLGITIIIAIFFIIYFNKTPTDSVQDIKPYTEENELKIANTQNNKEQQPICIASFTTNITYNSENRVHNIKTICNYLNNHVIKAGEVFSFNEVLGPFNEQKGYLESTGFDTKGNTIKIIAGGICQVSSTLYNTALMIDLSIIERHAHSAPVDYVPYGKDATVCYSGADLKFKNNKSYDITIKSSCDGEIVKIELYKSEKDVNK